MSYETLLNFEKSKDGAIIVGVRDQEQSQEIDDELNELEALLDTLGIAVKGRVIQKRGNFSASHLLSSGKVLEATSLAQEHQVHLIVVDHPLSGIQVKNMEKDTQCQVLDRSGVILDIFSRHAKTYAAKTQVEIAMLEYLLPRLTGFWTHFQRQTGGGVKARGMGEKQIEIDRRRARERIVYLQKKLEKVSKERLTQRKARMQELKVSLVGYTNSGKTTIMGGLTRITETGKNELFATLDAHVKMLDPTTRPKILLSDTVGFIRNLPHSLVESFKSTLEEVRNADLLLHVVDISHISYQQQIETTEKVLEEIKADHIPQILIFNKEDLVKEEYRAKILRKRYPLSFVLSAFDHKKMRELREYIFKYFETFFHYTEFNVESSDKKTLSMIHQHCVILDSDYTIPGEILFKVRAPERTLKRISLLKDERGKAHGIDYN